MLSNKILNDLKRYNELYIIGHNNIDCDSYFSSYILYKVLKKFNINVFFSILDTYNILEEDKKIINDFKIEEPVIINSKDLTNKKFILVDHNDPDQSIKTINNIVLAIDHHIETNKVKNCYSVEYTSTCLYIYDIFKDIYKFNKKERNIIALTVMTDSCFLTTSRFKVSDKLLYEELNSSLEVNKIRKKYFVTTDFTGDITYNITNSHKVYHVESYEVNRVIVKAYEKDRKHLEEYVCKSNEIYSNNLFIWNEFDTLKTLVYFRGEFLKEYDHIITSSMLITKDLIKEIKNKYKM